MSNCTNCGAALASDARFCTSCGTAGEARTGPTTDTVPPEAWGAPAPTPKKPRRVGRMILFAFLVLLGLGTVASALGGTGAEPSDRATASTTSTTHPAECAIEAEAYVHWATCANSGLTASMRLMAARTPIPATKVEGAYSVAPTDDAPLVIALSSGVDTAGMRSLCEEARKIFTQVRLVGTDGAILVSAHNAACTLTDAGRKAAAAADTERRKEDAARREQEADLAMGGCRYHATPETGLYTSYLSRADCRTLWKGTFVAGMTSKQVDAENEARTRQETQKILDAAKVEYELGGCRHTLSGSPYTSYTTRAECRDTWHGTFVSGMTYKQVDDENMARIKEQYPAHQ